MDQKAAIEKKVESLLSSMTLEEKIGQMSQVSHCDGDTEGAAVWLPGSVGDVVAGVLFGVHNIHGMQTYSWPKSKKILRANTDQIFGVIRCCLYYHLGMTCTLNKDR